MIMTVCPRSRDPFYIVSYYIKWVTTSWTFSTIYDIQASSRPDKIYDQSLIYNYRMSKK